MAAPRKYSDEHREALCHLVNDEHHTVAEAVQLIAAGHNGLAPETINEDYARQITRQDRQARGPSLENKPLPEALDVLARQAFGLANRELSAMSARNGSLDADSFLKIARALKELQPLAQARPANPERAATAPLDPEWVTGLNHLD